MILARLIHYSIDLLLNIQFEVLFGFELLLLPPEFQQLWTDLLIVVVI